MHIGTITDLDPLPSHRTNTNRQRVQCYQYITRFKLDSGAHGNLIPKSMFQRLNPSLPYSELSKSIDKWETLVAYNKQDIKQLGQCCVNVCNSSMGKSKTCKFFVVEDKCNPIIELNDSIALQLLSVNVPFTDKWSGNAQSKRSNSRCDEMETEEIGQQKASSPVTIYWRSMPNSSRE